MQRDEIKDRVYFQSFIEAQESSINRFTTALNEKKNALSPERERGVYATIFQYALHRLIAMYSYGIGQNELAKEYQITINYFEKSWGDSESFRFGESSEPYLSSDEYWQLLTMVSLARLLNMEGIICNRLNRLRRVIKEEDSLLDGIIKSEVDSKIECCTFMETNPFKETLAVLIDTGASSAQENLKIFLQDSWYPATKNLYWHNAHKINDMVYFGYWSFESAAIVKIMGLDDSSLKDCQYYPYDLVHWK